MKSRFYVFLLFSIFCLSCKNEIAAQDKSKKIEEKFKKEQGILVDVRTDEEWNEGHHPNAIHADWNGGEFKKQMQSWDTSKSYFLHCAGGGRSEKAVEYMKSKGFIKSYNLGGYDQVKNLKLDK
jgi:rhodanese-related sulfurtransferase